MPIDDEDTINSADKAMNYYEILGLQARQHEPTISPDDFRHAYKRALLHYHPDKKGTSGPKLEGQLPAVDDISRAYKILQDPKSRAQYDNGLHFKRRDARGYSSTRHTGIETVDLEDLDFNEDSSTWTRSCRCGSNPAFVVAESELEKNADFGELVTGCKGCSLWLKVLFTVNE